MSNISRVIARLMAKENGAKYIHGNIFNINPLIEWIKWLSYETEEEKERKELLNHLKPQELTEEQLGELQKYKRQDRLCNMFIKYDKGECTRDEYEEVYDYTVKHSIMDLMISKLTKQELIEAHKIVENCKLLPQEVLYKIVQTYKEEEHYKNLSHFDAFVLHIISDICYQRGLDNLDRSVFGQTEYRLFRGN